MTKLKEAVFVTGNQNKVNELSRMLGMMIKQKDLKIPELQSMDVSAVAKKKARDAFELVQALVIVEDSGLVVEAWGDCPGALIKQLVDPEYRNIGLEGFCKIIPRDNRNAVAISYFAMYNGKSWIIGQGRCKGTLAESPRGRTGFCWDTIFIPKGYDQTFAEMGAQKKDTCSARSLAIADLKKHLG